MTSPLVTVLMPVYNGQAFVGEAIESILAQTFSDFEFLIIDDGSTDATPDILLSYARRDKRIRVERNPINCQIAASLNRGLELAVAPLVVRMDADDVSLPARLEKQVAFMASNPAISVCGSYYNYFDSDEVHRVPLENDNIRAQLLFACCLAHPTVIFRKKAIISVGGYSPEAVPAEDYDLWDRLSLDKTVHFANLPEELLLYRRSNTVSSGGAFRQIWEMRKVHKRALSRLGLDVTDEALTVHWFCTGYDAAITPLRLLKAKAGLMNILQANNSARVYPYEAMIYEVFSRMDLLENLHRIYEASPRSWRGHLRDILESFKMAGKGYSNKAS